jgi:hypothetical protein
MATGSADETRLNVGQPDNIWPAVAVAIEHDVVMCAHINGIER